MNRPSNPHNSIIKGALLSFLAAGSSVAFAQDADAFKLTPTGFFSFTAVSRSTNTGSNLPTGFASIPYNNQVQGKIGELRFSSADTRLGLKTGVNFGDMNLKAYVEGDFLGADPANAYVTSNSHPFRLRLAYADMFMGDWELLVGQAFSWVTPNRKGLSADPSEVFTTLGVDPNNHVGLAWTRAAQIRAAYHVSDVWAFGLALESPDQYVGAGEVILPFAFNAAIGTQVDAGNTTAAPNQFPDVIGKVAFDPSKGVHIEALGLYRKFEVTYLDLGTFDFAKKDATGTSFGLNANVEVFDGFRLIGNAFKGSGGGRYIFGLGPDFVVVPDASGKSVSLSTVDSSAYLGGLEWQINPTNLLAAYYGTAKFEKNTFLDTTSPLVTKPYIGFGGPNSPSSANKMIREYTLDYHHTFWAKQGKGTIKGLFQISHVSREPWFVVAGAPPKAQTNMVYAALRYILPS